MMNPNQKGIEDMNQNQYDLWIPNPPKISDSVQNRYQNWLIPGLDKLENGEYLINIFYFCNIPDILEDSIGNWIENPYTDTVFQLSIDLLYPEIQRIVVSSLGLVPITIVQYAIRFSELMNDSVYIVLNYDNYCYPDCTDLDMIVFESLHNLNHPRVFVISDPDE